jgi:3-deoxy-manno-octulosonate cytidylyltransferase (CMP-KDO synthetase)
VHPVTFRNPFERTSQPLRIVAVIPARFDATRLPGKPLADIDGKPMIEHVYRRAAAAKGVDAVVVATDDERIVRAVEGFGGVARMTGTAHRTGTDRLAEVARDLDCEIVLNVQGDEPLVEPSTIEAIIEPMQYEQWIDMTTACTPLTDEADFQNPNVVKVVRSLQGHALYFSRSPVPFVRGPRPAVYKHLGLYGYRRQFLLEFAALPQTPLELSESLEQLRALEHGLRIHTAVTPYDSIGVDTPDDLERVRQMLAATRT